MKYIYTNIKTYIHTYIHPYGFTPTYIDFLNRYRKYLLGNSPGERGAHASSDYTDIGRVGVLKYRWVVMCDEPHRSGRFPGQQRQ